MVFGTFGRTDEINQNLTYEDLKSYSYLTISFPQLSFGRGV